MKAIIILFSLLIFVQPVPETAFDFEATTVNGETVKLSDYKGKVVYLSFWASWCGVCKRNFYSYKDVRKTLEEKGVVLLNISMDKQKEDWTQSMETFSIDGDHGLVKNYDRVMQEYGINSLPRYEIINKKGELVYLSQDGNRNIFQEFDIWLKE